MEIQTFCIILSLNNLSPMHHSNIFIHFHNPAMKHILDYKPAIQRPHPEPHQKPIYAKGRSPMYFIAPLNHFLWLLRIAMFTYNHST